ncbi:MAG: ribonuclease P protein component [Patescibacteria group bacterium]|jgi:ribonuclease P protein component
MLKKINRINRDKEFDRVFKMGKSNYSKFLGVKMVKNELGTNRLGILVSTKVSKKAVIRNKIKRQIREIFYQETSKMLVGYDFVIVVFSEILEKNFEELSTILKKSFDGLGVYNKKNNNK